MNRREMFKRLAGSAAAVIAAPTATRTIVVRQPIVLTIDRRVLAAAVTETLYSGPHKAIMDVTR
jgi:hypothetical protein